MRKRKHTLRIGTDHRSGADFRMALGLTGVEVEYHANKMLDHPFFRAVPEVQEVDVVDVSVAELGFEHEARRIDIYDAAYSCGLEVCPPEVAPQQLLQSSEPLPGWRILAMEPIPIPLSDCVHSGFTLTDLGIFMIQPYLGRYRLVRMDGSPHCLWPPHFRWMFLRGRCPKFQP